MVGSTHFLMTSSLSVIFDDSAEKKKSLSFQRKKGGYCESENHFQGNKDTSCCFNGEKIQLEGCHLLFQPFASKYKREITYLSLCSICNISYKSSTTKIYFAMRKGRHQSNFSCYPLLNLKIFKRNNMFGMDLHCNDWSTYDNNSSSNIKHFFSVWRCYEESKALEIFHKSPHC